jgi:soluble lytic murein transglycosylase-like protein
VTPFFHRPWQSRASLAPATSLEVRLERFEELSRGRSPGLLALSLWTAVALPRIARPTLVVESATIRRSFTPRVAAASSMPLIETGEWQWRGVFAVPPRLAADPESRYALWLDDEPVLALPALLERALTIEEQSSHSPGRRAWPYVVRRGALLFVVTCQLSVLPAWAPGGALADAPSSPESAGETSSTPPPPAETTGQAPTPPPSTGSGEPPPEAIAKETGPEGSATTTSTTPTTPTTSAVAPSPSTSSAPSAANVPVAPSATSPRGASPATKHATRVHPLVAQQRSQPTTVSSGHHAITGRQVEANATAPASAKPGVATGPSGVALAPQVVAAQAGALAAELAGSPASAGSLDFYRIPPFLLPIYQAAAAQYGVPWQILAAINEVETDYGSDLSVSSAGAVGWMQFMPSTWLQYGVDALDSGSADPYNPVDAIFAAARYLRAAGATTDLRAAILAYNHSGAYLESVLLRAKLISSYPDLAIGTLTSLIDDGTPVTGSQLGLGSETAGSSSSATGGAMALRRGSARALSPSAAAAAASAATRNTSSTPRLIEVLSAPKAAAVAVQDGRIVAVGSSRKLGRYVVLRDLYGDSFTYSGLARIARVERRAPAQTNTGKVRLYLHPGNADTAEAHSAATVGSPQQTAKRAERDHQLSVGSLVKKGTALGYVRTPPGAEDGHLRFAISPAGDSGTIDPRPILENWMLLERALHPRGASAGEVLRGATVGDVALLSTSELQRDILSDPGISMAACVHREATSGSLDKRAMGVLAFLSRSGLKPTVGTPGCGSGGQEIALTRVNGVAIAGHQGSGSVAEATVRALLTLHGSLAPQRIVTLRRYANAPSTVARPGHSGYIEIVFSPGREPVGTRARSAAVGVVSPRPGSAVMLGAVAWEQLIARIGSLPSPNVRTTPSSASIPDPRSGATGAASSAPLSPQG